MHGAERVRQRHYPALLPEWNERQILRDTSLNDCRIARAHLWIVGPQTPRICRIDRRIAESRKIETLRRKLIAGKKPRSIRVVRREKLENGQSKLAAEERAARRCRRDVLLHRIRMDI